MTKKTMRHGTKKDDSQNALHSDNQNQDELYPNLNPSSNEEYSFDVAELNKLIENLSERFEILQEIADHHDDKIFYGVFRASGWPITIQFTRRADIFEKACHWQNLVKTESEFEQIIETGNLDFGYYYIVSQLITRNDSTLLSANLDSSPHKAIDLVCQICKSITKLHNKELVFGELDPSGIVFHFEGGAIVLDKVRRPFYRKILGVSIGNNEQETIRHKESDKIEIESIGYQINWLQIHQLPSWARKLFFDTPISGWMYTLLNPFIAPECVMQIGDERSDVYSLGALLYWLLTNETHINLKDEFESQRMDEGFLPDNMSSYNMLKLALEPIYMSKLTNVFFDLEKVPTELRDVLSLALSGLPEKRFPTPLNLSKALENLELSSLMITIVDDKNKPVVNAQVTITPNDSTDELNFLTDKNGQAQFEHLFSGLYNVDVTCKNYTPVHKKNVTVSTNSSTLKIEIQKEPGAMSKFFNFNKRAKE